MKSTLAVVLGTARTGCRSRDVWTYLLDVLARSDVVAPVSVTVEEHVKVCRTLPPWDAEGSEHTATPWQEMVKSAQGLLLVVPEYNRGYPGELKLLLDSLYDDYRHKPVILCGVSDGAWGGSRVVEHVKPVLSELGLIAVRPALHVALVESFFAPERAADRAAFEKRLMDAVTELTFLSSRLST